MTPDASTPPALPQTSPRSNKSDPSTMDGLQRETQTCQIPVIDIGDPSTADRLVDAAASYGFVFIKGENLGFTADILNETFALVRLDFLAPK